MIEKPYKIIPYLLTLADAFATESDKAKEFAKTYLGCGCNAIADYIFVFVEDYISNRRAEIELGKRLNLIGEDVRELTNAMGMETRNMLLTLEPNEEYEASILAKFRKMCDEFTEEYEKGGKNDDQ